MTDAPASPGMGMSAGTRVRLSAMMFLQYAIHAVWIVPLAAYLGGSKLGFTGSQIGTVANAAPWGCLLAPIFVGMVADRFFPSEKVLAILNVVGGGMLFWASTITEPTMLFVVLLVQQICYMPTWAITNSIAIANCTDTEKDLPHIRVFGSIGWVATALFGIVAAAIGKEWDTTALPMMAAGALSIIAGAFAFALPHTPPPAAGKKSSIADVLGLKALAMMKNPSFAVFIVVSLIALIPFAAYWTFFSLYLANLGVNVIAGTMHLGQFIEIFVMAFLLPIALKKLGVKWTLVLGIAALALRYVAFLFGNGDELMFLNYIGILVHGLIFSFFFVTGYVYADRVAPKELRAQGQALIMLVTFGAGMLIGNYINGKIVDANAIPGEPVAAAFKMPAAIPAAPAATLPDANMSDTVVYARALSDPEMSVLNAEQQEQRNEKLIKRLREEHGDKVKLDEGKTAALAAPKGVTFSTWLYLSKKKDAKLSGTIFKAGQGDSALELSLDDGRLGLQAGTAKIAYVAPLATGKKVHVAGTFDGKLLKLYTDGKPYTRWQWDRVWLWPAIISAVLALLMVVFFHVPRVGKTEAAPEPAAEEPAEEAPADEGEEQAPAEEPAEEAPAEEAESEE